MTERYVAPDGKVYPVAPGWQQNKAYYDAAGNNIPPWEINRDPADLARYLRNYEQSYRELHMDNPASAYYDPKAHYDKTGVLRVPGLNA